MDGKHVNDGVRTAPDDGPMGLERQVMADNAENRENWTRVTTDDIK